MRRCDRERLTRSAAHRSSGLDLPVAGRAKAPDLEVVADLCSSMARVQDTRELQGLLERTARALDASGVIVWMPDGPQGSLRPVLAHGYASLSLSRMGIIHPAADNATATAYRTKSVVVVPAEVLASGAVVAPLISSEGCSGAMAVELREGVEADAAGPRRGHHRGRPARDDVHARAGHGCSSRPDARVGDTCTRSHCAKGLAGLPCPATRCSIRPPSRSSAARRISLAAPR